MKKGIVSSVLGFVVFFVAFFIIFLSDSETGFFIMGPIVFIFIFVTLIIGVTKFLKKQADNSSYQNNNYQGLNICDKCHSSIEKSANYCPVCGASQKDTVICEYCGHENPKSNALCEKCNGFL
jgi:hypothetical protein